MKKALISTLLILLAFTFFLVSSCELPTDAKDETTPPTSLLVGSWKRTKENAGADGFSETAGHYICVPETILTFGSDLTFLEVRKDTIVYDNETIANTITYFYQKGTWSLDTGKLTQVYTNNFITSTLVSDLSTITWTSASRTNYQEVAIHDDHLYFHAYKRSGSGIGIDGTWITETYASENEDEPYNKTVFSIKTPNITIDMYDSTTSTFKPSPSASITGHLTYNTSPGTGVISANDIELSFLVIGDYLVLTDDNPDVYTKL